MVSLPSSTTASGSDAARSAARRRAAFFDVDRTLLRVNSATHYLAWQVRTGQTDLVTAARHFRWIAQYSLGVIDAADVSRRVLAELAGVEEASFRAETARWFDRSIRRYLTRPARAEVARRRLAGDVLVILSASTPYVVEPLARTLGIEHVLCTELEVVDGRFSGRAARLRYGSAKLIAAREFAAEHDLDLEHSAFYTDSISDLPLLLTVGEPRVVNPDLRLGREATRRGWSIDRWR